MKAIVLGATGLVGSTLVDQLLIDSNFDQVIAISRSKIEKNYPKFSNVIMDFENMKNVSDRIHGDIVFSCLGTTIKKAGSKEKFIKVDYEYQYNFLKMASDNGIKKLVLISSPGANTNGMSLYLKTKGKLDEKVKNLQFDSIAYIKPSFLDGERNEKRFLEELAINLGNSFWGHIPLIKKYRPIKADIVAKAMRKLALDSTGPRCKSLELDEIFKF